MVHVTDSALPPSSLEAGALISTRLDRAVLRISFRDLKHTDKHATRYIKGVFVLQLVMTIIERMFRDDILRFEGMPTQTGYAHAQKIARSIQKEIARELEGGCLRLSDLSRLVEFILFRFMRKHHLIVLLQPMNKHSGLASLPISYELQSPLQ